MNGSRKGFEESLAEDQAHLRLEKDIQAVRNDISHLSQQISAAVSVLSDIAQSQSRLGIRRARRNVNALMSDAPGRAGAVAGAAQDAGAAMADAIEDRPLATVAIAMGIGFLIGVTWRR